MATTDRRYPMLALALAAATSSRLALDAPETDLGSAFVPAVATMDEADRAYRRAIEDRLPKPSASDVLSAMAAFRERVHAVRERTRGEIEALYRRYDRSYGSLDPLDPSMAAVTGLSHVDGTRLATIADNGRAEVDALRARVNEAVAARLEANQIDALIAAKRQRRAAFEAALERALAAALAPHPGVAAAEAEKMLFHLVQLADGWY